MSLPPQLRERIALVIEEFDLHHTSPVSLLPVMRAWGIKVRPWPMPSWVDAIHIPETQIGAHALIAVNDSLTLPQMQVAIAHELGHRIAGHPNGFHTLLRNRWLSDKLEREAQLIASCLLIPAPHEPYYGLTAEEWASLCGVTPELVRLHVRSFHPDVAA
jgi:hypothetical protein